MDDIPTQDTDDLNCETIMTRIEDWVDAISNDVLPVRTASDVIRALRDFQLADINVLDQWMGKHGCKRPVLWATFVAVARREIGERNWIEREIGRDGPELLDKEQADDNNND